MYLPSLVAFVVLDGIWIGLVASDFYMSRSDSQQKYQGCLGHTLPGNTVSSCVIDSSCSWGAHLAHPVIADQTTS